MPRARDQRRLSRNAAPILTKRAVKVHAWIDLVAELRTRVDLVAKLVRRPTEIVLVHRAGGTSVTGVSLALGLFAEDPVFLIKPISHIPRSTGAGAGEPSAGQHGSGDAGVAAGPASIDVQLSPRHLARPLAIIQEVTQ
jgi:hypothetical protein